MAYLQNLPRQDLRRYRFRVNTVSSGPLNLGTLPEGWDPDLYFWPNCIHLALADSTWLTFPQITIGAGASTTSLLSATTTFPNTVGNQLVRISTATGAAGSALIGIADDILVNVVSPGSVSVGGDNPFISIDLIGFWDYLAGASVI